MKITRFIKTILMVDFVSGLLIAVKEMFKSNNKKIKDFIKSTNPKLFI